MLVIAFGVGVWLRHLLSHQAGLFAFSEPVDKSVVGDLDRLAIVLARQKPAWEPGSRQAYHAISLGFFESELLRRVDPQHRSLGQFFQDEIASPLELDFYIRLPESIPTSRLAVIEKANPFKMLANLPFRLMLASMNDARRRVRWRGRRARASGASILEPTRIYRPTLGISA